MPIIDFLKGSPPVIALTAALEARRRVAGAGAAGSSTALLAGAIARRTGRAVVLVVAHLDDADEGADELNSLGVPAYRLPALEVLPGESNVSLELFAERLSADARLGRATTSRSSTEPFTSARLIIFAVTRSMRISGSMTVRSASITRAASSAVMRREVYPRTPQTSPTCGLTTISSNCVVRGACSARAAASPIADAGIISARRPFPRSR